MSDSQHLHIVVMGVTGTGKSTVAQALAAELDLVMAEGDDYHPEANIEKMSAGIALDDDDRTPWLEALAQWTREQHEAGHDTVLTCSALRRPYRDTLRGGVPESTFFIHLVGSADVLTERIEARDHFMPASLLDSQLETLEDLEPDEDGEVVDVDRPLEQVVEETLAIVRRL
ncbi:gluconokinase [Nocardioides bizhenqiangii]|uniref:Gluconokinase n=1 Tax=Nocardioides bizhenqiangii TaxID=3095076 RepID=A0ABZ0ZX26_9ACTN|nr:MULTISPECIES: gluconokinase [unclassified Nocardioides]MDZ5623261.1 gluconokinase [Nocardioides sp. HM23]WQQ28232.1 gluconokinase [Nocardioides sp. HM61]